MTETEAAVQTGVGRLVNMVTQMRNRLTVCLRLGAWMWATHELDESWR